MLFNIILSIATSIISGILYAIFGTAIVGTIISYLVTIALFLPGLGVAVRRLHDIGKAGGYIFLGLIPIVGFIILLIWFVKPSEPVPNRFGDVPVC